MRSLFIKFRMTLPVFKMKRGQNGANTEMFFQHCIKTIPVQEYILFSFVFFRAKDARMREFFEKSFPEIKKSREDKERLSRSEFTSDYYTSFLVLTHVYMWLWTVDNYSSLLSSNSAWIIIFVIVKFLADEVIFYDFVVDLTLSTFIHMMPPHSWGDNNIRMAYIASFENMIIFQRLFWLINM